MSRLPYEIVRSARRAKTVQAEMADGRVRVLVPASMSEEEARRFGEELADRIARRRRGGEADLTSRAQRLSARYRLPPPRSIEWSGRQRRRWGSSTPSRGSIRISTRLADMPEWVLDYVIVHELSHLAEQNHGAAFWRLVSRYPLTERARGYLLAMEDR